MGTVMRDSTSCGVMPGALSTSLTWVVETSGKASTGSARQAITPAATPIAVSTSTSRRWRNEKSINRLSTVPPDQGCTSASSAAVPATTTRAWAGSPATAARPWALERTCTGCSR